MQEMRGWVMVAIALTEVIGLVWISAMVLRRRGLAQRSPAWLMALVSNVAGAMTSGCLITTAFSWLVFGSMASYQTSDMNFVIATGLPLLLISLISLPVVHGLIYLAFGVRPPRHAIVAGLLTGLLALLSGIVLLGAAWALGAY
jgi:hypothetical protein